MWGILPNSSTVTNSLATCSVLPVISPSYVYNIIGCGGNNGGTSWGNINFVYENGIIKASAWINGTGTLVYCKYHLIGI